MAAEYRNLPDEIWAYIFTLIPNHHHHRFEALSLVCKQFLTLTNHLKRTLHLLPSYPTPQTLPTLLRRFTNLGAIDASGFSGDLDQLVYLIYRSGLPIQEISFANQKYLPVKSLSQFGTNFRDLKVLKCAEIGTLRNSHLVAIAEAVPWIQDLDISFPENDCDLIAEFGLSVEIANLSDAGIEQMSVKLPDLMKINLSGNPFISDRAIVALATNCGMLREIVADHCCLVTQIGIADAMKKCPNLTSVSFSRVECGYSESSIIRSGRSLSALNFSNSSISDEFLCSVVEARLPLKQLTVFSCLGFSLAGISTLITAYRSLTHLNLERVDCLTDEAMVGMTEFLPSLASVSLNSCYEVGNLTLFAIIKCCRFIEQVSMDRTSLGKGWAPTDAVFPVNRSMRSLKASSNSLSDECALWIASACPDLEVLDLSECREITASGITQILCSCKEIRHLSLNNLKIGKLMKWDKCKVEVLEMKSVRGIDDDQLNMISEGCPNLLCVDLWCCLNLSSAAVKRLVKKCTKLREMRLDWYEEMSYGNLASMVFQRRSLRKVVVCNVRSSNLLLSEKQKHVLLRHGCRIVQN